MLIVRIAWQRFMVPWQAVNVVTCLAQRDELMDIYEPLRFVSLLFQFVMILWRQLTSYILVNIVLRKWLGAYLVPSHYLNQWWLIAILAARNKLVKCSLRHHLYLNHALIIQSGSSLCSNRHPEFEAYVIVSLSYASCFILLPFMQSNYSCNKSLFLLYRQRRQQFNTSTLAFIQIWCYGIENIIPALYSMINFIDWCPSNKFSCI